MRDGRQSALWRELDVRREIRATVCGHLVEDVVAGPMLVIGRVVFMIRNFAVGVTMGVF